MKTIKTLALALVASLGLMAGSAYASGGGVAWDKAPGKITDQASLQHGAKLFVNYCLNCHSASFVRFNRLKDIGLTEPQIKGNLLFTSEKVGDTMQAAISPKQAAAWFGANPPDLSLVARSRAGAGGSGADYLYTFLRSFYRDDSKPNGWANTAFAFPTIAMPHPLWELQGERRPVFETVEQNGKKVQHFTGKWEQVKPGTMSTQDYDKAVGDLVNFMNWMAEPMQSRRKTLGVWVLLFLALFTFTAWKLNQAYWKDVQ